MIPPLRKWCDKHNGSWLTIGGDPAHLVWWRLMASAVQRLPADDRFRRTVQGRPVQRALLIADMLAYPAWWALHIAVSVALAPLDVLAGGVVPAFMSVVSGIAGPRNPRSVSRLLRVLTRLDPPPLRAAWFRRDGGGLYVIETREQARLPGEVT